MSRPGPIARRAAAPALAIAAACAWLATLFALPALRIAGNRLLVGDPVSGLALGGGAIPVAALCGAVGLLLLGRDRGRLGAGLAVALLVTAGLALGLGLGAGASSHLAGRPSAARASLGSGAWVGLALLAIGAGWAAGRGRIPGLLPVAVALGGLTLAGHLGAFDALSLAVELHARREATIEALYEHVALSGGALVLAIACAALLSLWRRGQGLVGAVISGVQVIPAVALLGGLVALVSGALRAAPALRDLGISALGPAPAVIGIAAYLALPLWRGIAAALRAPDPAIRDAATAIGLTRWQILTRVTLPLGAPALIGALRVATVQGLGLATLGALIGAGGLGRIVFDGMAQFAPDLILLGAIPIVALSLGAERLLAAAEAQARRRWRA